MLRSSFVKVFLRRSTYSNRLRLSQPNGHRGASGGIGSKQFQGYAGFRKFLQKPSSTFVATLSFSAVATGFAAATLNGVTAASNLQSKANKDNQFSRMLKDVDALYDAVKYEEMYNLLLPHKDEQNDEIKWRLARANYRMSKLAFSKEDKLKFLKEAKSYAFQALELNQDNFAAHKWAAILIIEVAEQEGMKSKIEKSIVSKDHMLKAHQLNPTDGTTLYLLGVWCFSFADLSWTQRKLASVVFATPPTSTFEEALNFFSKAESSDPNFYSKNLLMLGKTHLKLNDKDKAIPFLKRARDYPLKTQEDKEATKEAAELLKSLGVP